MIWLHIVFVNIIQTGPLAPESWGRSCAMDLSFGSKYHTVSCSLPLNLLYFAILASIFWKEQIFDAGWKLHFSVTIMISA